MALSASIRSLTDRASRAVVEIQVTGYGPVDEEQQQQGQTSGVVARQRAVGSGVIVDSSGYIITNAHVVRGAIRVSVVLGGRTPDDEAVMRVIPATVIGVDRETDLALLKIARTNLPVLHFAPRISLHQGDLVLAIGSPLGLRNSVSMGVISSTARAVSETNPLAYIQTDASINPGNSGGALVDTEGRLVGVNTFIYTQSGGSEGIGFAIPVATVAEVYRQLREKGHVHRGEAGVYLQEITPALAQGLSLKRQTGVVISDVEPDGPADQAGARPGDILLSVDGQRIESVRRFVTLIYRRSANEQLKFLVLRGDEEVPLVVKVRERASQMDMLSDLAAPEKHLVRRLGVLGLDLDKKLAARLPELRLPYGVVVAARSTEGQAQYVDLQPGDVIHALNTVPVTSMDFLREQLDAKRPGDVVVLQIEREGRLVYVAFEIE